MALRILTDDCGMAGEIMLALQIHNTIGIDAIQEQAKASNVMLGKLFAMLEQKSDKEKAWEQSLTLYGGRERVLGSDELITKVSNQIEGRTAMDGPTDARPGNRKPRNNKDDQILSAKERLEIQRPLRDSLQANLDVYEIKLQSQIQRLSDELKESTQKILDRLDAGSYEKIRNPEVRQVWKDMVRLFTL